MKELFIMNAFVAVVFVTCFFYQFIYMVISLTKKQKKFVSKRNHKYAVIISARDESSVIAQLIESIKWQKYPRELVDIFVVADNCTDNTAEVARQSGAIVYERFNCFQKGKGYALDYLLKKMKEDYSTENYEGFFVFDADNILDENYITEMNHIFDEDYKVVTSYRDSKNFSDSWVSSGYSLWFLKEARYLNNPRMTLGTSCMVSGTGFLISASTIEELGGWKFFSLTEDIEFSFNCIANGERIGYAQDAIFYDEQPVSLNISITQRSRWIKGTFQVLHKYGITLLKRVVTKGDLASFDALMNTAGIIACGSLGLGMNILVILVELFLKPHPLHILLIVGTMLLHSYCTIAFIGILVLITEHKYIRATTLEKVRSIATFPLFVSTYTIAFFVAVFVNVEWKPIPHKPTVLARAMKS